MTTNRHHGERRIRVRSVRRDPPDLRKLSRAIIDLALAQAEAEAQRAHEEQTAAKPEKRAGQKTTKERPPDGR